MTDLKDITGYFAPESMPEDAWQAICDKHHTVDGRKLAIKRWIDEQKKAQLPVQLPFWPEPKRASPNAFLRSAVFPAIQGKNRQYIERKVLASQKGYELRFTGQQLNQSDLDVWLESVHLARCSPIGDECHFKGNAFLKSLGRRTGGKDHLWLQKVILRLRSAVIEIKKPNGEWGTYNLLSEASGSNADDIYKFRTPKPLIELFAPDSWTGLEWEQRKALKGKPLALWLHGYYSSHQKPFPLKIETIIEWSGSQTKNKKHFVAALKRAIGILQKITGWKIWIEEGKLYVDNKLSIAPK